MPLVRIDEEEKRQIVDVAIAASRAQSRRSKSKLSPEEAMHRALGQYTLLRKAANHEICGGAVLFPDEIAAFNANSDSLSGPLEQWPSG